MPGEFDHLDAGQYVNDAWEELEFIPREPSNRVPTETHPSRTQPHPSRVEQLGHIQALGKRSEVKTFKELLGVNNTKQDQTGGSCPQKLKSKSLTLHVITSDRVNMRGRGKAAFGQVLITNAEISPED